MFRDTSRRGNQHVVAASRVLSDAFVFPAQDARAAHLGYQLAWLTAPGDRAARQLAASDAEQLTVSPTMDPSLERNDLGPLVDKWQADKRQPTADSESSATAIAAVLQAELARRWNLTEAAYQLLAGDPRRTNPGVASLIQEAHSEFWFQHQRIELRLNDPSQGPAFVAHPETDFHGSAAASRYLIHAAADEAYIGNLIHDDPELFREALDDGKAVRGKVTTVEDVGSGRSSLPQWVVELDPGTPNRLRENGRVVPFGSRGHEATIVAIAVTPSSLELRIEWTTRKTMALTCGIGAKPADPAWLGQNVAFVMSDAADLTRRRSSRVWKAKDGPGAWLTHGKPPAPIQILGDDGGSDLLVDDITQIADGLGA